VDESRIAELVDRLDLADKVRLVTGRDFWTLQPMPQIGLRSVVLSDGPAGVRGEVWDERSPSINFPSPTCLAAGWDRQAVYRVGEALGAEAVRKGVDVVLAPTINLHRSPYGGRHFEALSEDPLLTAELATAYVQGVQSRGVAATVKHYVANDSETERFSVDVRVDERPLREAYLAAFEGPVTEGGVWAVMSAYNSINGVTASEHPLLTTPLTDEWGFDGVVVSDWTAVRSLESARQRQDLAMPGPDGVWAERLLTAVLAGEVAERDIDEKVRRILRLAARVGALEGFGAKPSLPAVAGREVAAAAATDGMVLLSNDGTLPLRIPTSIAVIGENARAARTQGGGSATVIAEHVVAPLAGIQERWPDAHISWTLGAVVHEGLTDLPLDRFRTGSGWPGMIIRYLDAAGEEILAEHRRASGAVWFLGHSPLQHATVIEFRFELDTSETSPTRLGVAGLGPYDVRVDGEVVASGRLTTKPGDDPATAVLNPPFEHFAFSTPGTTADVVVSFRPEEGKMPHAMCLRVGTPPPADEPEALLAAAARAAAEAEVAVVVVGTSASVESEGFDRTSLALPGHQDALVRAVAAANPHTVVVVNSGAPVVLPWRDEAAAVVATWFPGQEFGAALARVLSGDQEPGGRLPVSWPADENDVPVRNVTPDDGRLEYTEGIHVGYRAWLRESRKPAYAFGFGLGYTTWELSRLESDPTLRPAGTLSTTAWIRNTGERAGKAVVQWYLERVTPSALERPARWLAGFEVVRLDPGEASAVRCQLSWRRFAHWAGAWEVEPGQYRLLAGFAVDDIAASVTVLAG
jgi:beta-glucosidase